MDMVTPPFYYSFKDLPEDEKKDLPEARSVTWFEISLFYQMLFGEQKYVIMQNLNRLPKVPIAIVHGLGDALCPAGYAENLEKELKKLGYQVTADYVQSGHQIVNNPILEAVHKAVENFIVNSFP